MEPEELAYGFRNEGYFRRAMVVCEDGQLRLAHCSVADTYFSIPAYCVFGGKRTYGFITTKTTDDEREDTVFVFKENSE